MKKHIYRLLFLAAMLIFALLSVSCSSYRNANTTHYVADTLHYIVTDTTHTLLVRDSLHVTHREEVTEHIVTIYDPQTGTPVRQDIDRTILRLADSIAAHLLDSLRAAISIEANASHADTLQHSDDEATGEASLSPIQTVAKSLSSVFALAFVVFAIICAIRIYRRV